MKKVLAFALMLVLAFSAAAVVSAAGDEVEFIEKGWVSEESGSDLVANQQQYPDIAIQFSIVSREARDNTNADYDDDANIPDVTFSKAAGTSAIKVSGLDDIDGAGIFTYKIKEIDPQVAGVTANTTEYTVEIMRTFIMVNDKATTDTETAYVIVYPVGGSNEKPARIDNIYVDGDLTIEKVVTGNLSYKDDTFTVELEFTSDLPVETNIVLPDAKTVEFAEENGKYVGTGTVTISDNSGVMTISGIPEGVTVTVTEQNPEPYELVGYSVNGGEDTKDAPSIVMTAEGAGVVIKNHYSTEIDTGISLDSLPYIIIIAGVAAAAVFFVIRKRRSALEID